MAEAVTHRVINDVALVQVDAPPANTLTPAIVRDLRSLFTRFQQDDRLQAIVLLARGRMFSAGIDVAAHDQPGRMPDVAGLCTLIENQRIPVIAALPGPALAAGAELALAAHYRIALPSAQIGLPDVRLGLMPGAGATQRLPRLIGPKLAMNLLLGGQSIGADIAREIGLIDRVVTEDLALNAVRMARRAMRPRPTSGLRHHLRDGAAYLRIVAERREKLDPDAPYVTGQLLDCVEGAVLLPFDAGLALEAECFEACRIRPRARALRHIHQAQRRIAPDLMSVIEGRYRVAGPKGAAVVAALEDAWQIAIGWLLGQGHDEQSIDRAHVAFGFAAGPFGGADPGSGAEIDLIQNRILAALVAEGARQMESGAVASFSDIDVLAVHALGFPRDKGGPMKAAEIAGLLALSAKMKSWGADNPVWSPPKCVVRAALEVRGFAALEE